MSNKYRNTLILSIIICAGSAGSEHERTSQFIKECQKPGNLLISGPTHVIDFEMMQPGGVKALPFCIQEYSCSIPSKKIDRFKSALGCTVDKHGNCESLENCGENFPTYPAKFGFGGAVSRKDSAKWTKDKYQCTQRAGELGLVYSMHLNAVNSTDYRSICVKELTCTDPNGVIKEHRFVACATTGKKVRDETGLESDECPGPNDCYNSEIHLPDEAEYKTYLADKAAAEKKKISETLPRNSQTTTSGSSTPGERHSKSK